MRAPLAALLVLGATTPALAGKYAGSKPNILILFADDLGSGDLGVYGHPTNPTPNLDRLAQEGMRFTQWYSAFHVCSPSRGSMMTGRIPYRIGLAGGSWTGGVFNSDAVGGIPSNETTIAEALKGAGYDTKAIGKWHLGQQPQYLPTANGFDEYYGIPYSCDMGSSAWRYYNSKDRPPLPLITSSGEGQVTIVEQPTDLNKLSGRYVNESIKFIEAHGNKSGADSDPWLLYMAFNHVHVPDFASPGFCNSTLRGRFGDALSELDAAVGAIMDAVASSGQDGDTITFFTSDNGPWLIQGLAGGSAGLLRDGKTTTWEGGVREPGLVRWPGKVPAGTISREIAATYDIFATASALAGVPPPQDRILDGKDLSDVLFDNGKTPHDCIFIYKGSDGLGCPKDHPDCTGLWAVRCGPYKLHYVTSNWTTGSSNGEFHDPPLIFQVENDPSEAKPLKSKSEEYKTQRQLIEAAVAEHRANMKYVPNMMALGVNPDLAICCDPNSQSKYPKLPNCTCNPENFDGVFVCSPVKFEDAFESRDSETWPMQERYELQEW